MIGKCELNINNFNPFLLENIEIIEIISEDDENDPPPPPQPPTTKTVNSWVPRLPIVKYVPTDANSDFIKSFNGCKINTKKPTAGDGA